MLNNILFLEILKYIVTLKYEYQIPIEIERKFPTLSTNPDGTTQQSGNRNLDRRYFNRSENNSNSALLVVSIFIFYITTVMQDLNL